MLLEFKEQRAHVWLKLGLSVWRQDQFAEQLRIEKAKIWLPGLEAIAGLSGEGGNGEFLPDFETHLEVFWYLI